MVDNLAPDQSRQSRGTGCGPVAVYRTGDLRVSEDELPPPPWRLVPPLMIMKNLRGPLPRANLGIRVDRQLVTVMLDDTTVELVAISIGPHTHAHGPTSNGALTIDASYRDIDGLRLRTRPTNPTVEPDTPTGQTGQSEPFSDRIEPAYTGLGWRLFGVEDRGTGDANGSGWGSSDDGMANIFRARVAYRRDNAQIEVETSIPANRPRWRLPLFALNEMGDPPFTASFRHRDTTVIVDGQSFPAEIIETPKHATIWAVVGNRGLEATVHWQDPNALRFVELDIRRLLAENNLSSDDVTREAN